MRIQYLYKYTCVFLWWFLHWGEPQWSSGYTSLLSSGRPGFDSRSWLPYIIHLFIVYIHRIHYHRPSDGDVRCWTRKMLDPCIGAVLRARKRTRSAVVEFHVSLYPNSVSPFLYARYMCEYNDLNSLYSPPPFALNGICYSVSGASGAERWTPLALKFLAFLPFVEHNEENTLLISMTVSLPSSIPG